MRNFPPTSEVVAVEQKDGEVISYMTEETLMLLQKVCQQTLFVPVTTRAYAQYERLHFIEKLQPTFAIISNGGILLENGRPNEAWAKIVRQRIEDSAISYAEMLQHFHSVKSSTWLKQSFHMDSLFAVHYVDRDALSLEQYQAMMQSFDKYGWRIWLNGRKLYMMPKILTKESAIAYLREHCVHDTHIAAGDSIMDYGMLAMADIGYTPSHGDLKDKQPQALGNTVYSTLNGEAFTKELLEAVLQLVVK